MEHYATFMFSMWWSIWGALGPSPTPLFLDNWSQACARQRNLGCHLEAQTFETTTAPKEHYTVAVCVHIENEGKYVPLS